MTDHNSDRLSYDTSQDFEMVFTVQLGSWAPRSALYAQAVEAADSTGSRIPSAPQVYTALRARGFTEAKRRGIMGFRDLTVPDRFLGAPRPKPAGTASAYKNRGDRSHQAREAALAGRLEKRKRQEDEGDPSNPYPYRSPRSPWFATPRSPEEYRQFLIESGWSVTGPPRPARSTA